MKIELSGERIWQGLFFGMVAAYCLLYAPYGVNETDGGFITGLAWQVLHGKQLFSDIVYVRPPLPVWMQAGVLQAFPDWLEIRTERWLFYIKVAAYCWMGASVLAGSEKKWILATFGFLLSAHSYPPMAWHTVDGILFAVLSGWLLFGAGAGGFKAVLASLALLFSLLCKQSFYPLLLLFPAAVWLGNRSVFRLFCLSFTGWLILFAMVFPIGSFWEMTSGSGTGFQAIQHGVVDYFRITPELAVPSLVLLAVGIRLHRFSTDKTAWIRHMWLFWLFALIMSFTAVTLQRGEHTVPFAQSRALFWVALVTWALPVWRTRNITREAVVTGLMIGIAWCASVSWGYNLPVLFSIPLVFGVMQVSSALKMERHPWYRYRVWLLATVLISFRIGYEFVYRDGPRSRMTEHLGDIFPKLTGIYSSVETAELYGELKLLSDKYGPDFTVLPAFPAANYLTNTPPPLPLDWVVKREMNGYESLVWKSIQDLKPVLFIEKKYLSELTINPELSLTRMIVDSCRTLEETRCFIVKKP